jgi:hypothetical protein
MNRFISENPILVDLFITFCFSLLFFSGAQTPPMRHKSMNAWAVSTNASMRDELLFSWRRAVNNEEFIEK